MTESSSIELLRGADNSVASGLLHDRIDPEYARLAQVTWGAHEAKQRLTAAIDRVPFPKKEHDHWDWHKKVSVSAHLLACPTLAIECENEVQGLMLVNTDEYQTRLSDDSGRPLVYIYFLAAAPWNLRQFEKVRRFRGVGQILIRAAILQSLDLGFKGRIGLHSLPQSEDFYVRHGFQCLGPDADKDGLNYYELSAAAAAAFVV